MFVFGGLRWLVGEVFGCIIHCKLFDFISIHFQCKVFLVHGYTRIFDLPIHPTWPFLGFTNVALP